MPALNGDPVALVPGYCTLCRSRCGAMHQIENGKLAGILPLAGHPTGGALCAKGRAAPEHLYSPLRLTRPLRRTNPRVSEDPGWVEISWDEALAEIARNLDKARNTLGPESVAFAVTTPSGTPMVDSFEWVERFIRCYGSPNLIYAIEVCGWHKDYAHALTYGRGIGVPDIGQSDTILMWGHNPARTWLAQATRMAEARRRGARIVVVDPRQKGSGQEADLWMRIRPGTDAALALGSLRHLLATRTYDHEFVGRWTNAPFLVNLSTGHLLRAADIRADGAPDAFMACRPNGDLVPFDDSTAGSGDISLYAKGRLHDAQGREFAYATVFHLLRRHVEPYTVEQVAHLTWIPESDIVRFNELFENAPRLSYHAWTGVGQHSNATQTERAIGCLYALTGACDRQGGNLWTVAPPYRPVNVYTDLLGPAQRAKALGLRDLPLGPPRFGFITARDFAAAVLDQDPYPVTMLMSFGTNMPVSQSDTARNLKALQTLSFHAHVDMYMSPMGQNADIVLPASMPWEREALRCGFEIDQAAVERVQLRRRMVEPLGEARADYDIVFDLASRLGMGDRFFGGDIEAGWNHQLEPLGITVDDLRRHPHGLGFPQPFGYEKYRNRNAEGKLRGFPTSSGVVELYSEPLLDIGQPALPCYVPPASLHVGNATDDFPLTLSTAKNGWFIHSSHRHIASLRKKAPHPQAEISPVLAARHGLAEGDWLYVVTGHGRVTLQARVDARLHDKVVIADFGWWQGCEPLGLPPSPVSGRQTFNTNAVLSDRHRDPVSGSVPMRAVACRIEPATELNVSRWQGGRPFRIARKSILADDIVAFALAPEDGGPLPGFLPGQHVLVSSAGGTLTRPYSLTGISRDPLEVSIGVRRELTAGRPDGRMSSHLLGLGIGARLLLSMPTGTFTIPVSSSRPIVLGASGIGITPFIGYLESLLAAPAGTRPPRVLLIYVCRDGGTHAYRDRLRELEAALPDVRVIVLYRRLRAADKPGIDCDAVRTLDFGWISDELVAQRALVYLCGSLRFIKDAREGIAARGLPAFDIFSEVFAAEAEVPPDLAAQPVAVEGEDLGFEWRPGDGTILDAAENAGAGLPAGCRVGQCESCMMHVVSGRVVHLTPYDGPPDGCLTCQAVPLTPLVLRR